MSYTIRIGDLEFTEPNKDEVIALLLQQWNDRTGLFLQVIWPDETSIEYGAFS